MMVMVVIIFSAFLPRLLDDDSDYYYFSPAGLLDEEGSRLHGHLSLHRLLPCQRWTHRFSSYMPLVSENV